MEPMQQLKKAVKLAAKLYDDKNELTKRHEDVELRLAADKAAETFGFDLQATTPIYLLLKNSWTFALAWADE